MFYNIYIVYCENSCMIQSGHNSDYTRVPQKLAKKSQTIRFLNRIACVMGIMLLELHGPFDAFFFAFNVINRKLQAFSKFVYPSLSETIIRKYHI